MAERPPPNFLFVMTDQHRPDHTGFGGNEIVRTPHLDRLAARAMRFDRCFVSNPICMPNRSTILTGRMPSVHGTRYNGIPLEWGANTFVRALRSAGYRTGLVGKAHLQNMGDMADLPIDALFPVPGDAIARPYPDGWDRLEDGHRHRVERVEFPDDFYGFEDVALTVNHSDICSGHYHQWLVDRGLDPSMLQGPKNALQSFEGWWQVYQTATPEDAYPSRYVAEQSVAFLDAAAADGRPFFLQCSFPDPHHPFTPPGRYYDMYDPAEMPLPATWDDPHEHSMPFYRKRLEHRGSQRAHVQPFAPTEEQLRHALAAEYGMISLIDDCLGDVFAALERNGLAEDTVVVFTSDHGDMFGDHGMMLKAGMHYEGCTRVPLLVARPGDAGGVSDALASSIDLPHTVLALAGVPEYHGMQGQSLVPVLDDAGANVRDDVLVEEDEIFDLARLGCPLRMRTLITKDGRISLYSGSDQGELFDLSSDPLELENQYARGAAGLQAELVDRLARRLMETDDRAPKPDTLA